ncbi:hypothetical protein C8R47DRAFT_1219292 [Mycena vitilis]|nr:hypothetical protein C8R47DRAFT_1219292 [Mycena vitilis]
MCVDFPTLFRGQGKSAPLHPRLLHSPVLYPGVALQVDSLPSHPQTPTPDVRHSSSLKTLPPTRAMPREEMTAPSRLVNPGTPATLDLPATHGFVQPYPSFASSPWRDPPPLTTTIAIRSDPSHGSAPQKNST